MERSGALASQMNQRNWHAWRKLGKAFRHFANHVWDRLVRPLKLYLMAQQTQFRVARNTLNSRQAMRDRTVDALRGLRPCQIIDLAELLDDVLMLNPAEVSQDQILIEDDREPGGMYRTSPFDSGWP